MDGLEVTTTCAVETMRNHEGFNLKYIEVGPDHPDINSLVKYVAGLRQLPRINPSPIPAYLENAYGPSDEAYKDLCKSKVIIFLVKTPDGKQFVGTNGTINNIAYCTRHLKEVRKNAEVGYEDCKAVEGCWQPHHAEVGAIFNLLVHYQLIDQENIESLYNIGTFNTQHQIGVINHSKLVAFIKSNQDKIQARLNGQLEVTMYGHEFCCDECATVLNAMGVNSINICKQTHSAEKKIKTEIHTYYLES